MFDEDKWTDISAIEQSLLASAAGQAQDDTSNAMKGAERQGDAPAPAGARRLRYCAAPTDLPKQHTFHSTVLDVKGTIDLSRVRHAARRAALVAGFSESRSNSLILSVGEAAMAALLNAADVQVVIQTTTAGSIQVWVTGHGTLLPGTMAHGRTSSSHSGMNHVLSMILPGVDRAWIYSGEPVSTLVLEQEHEDYVNE